ncbi:MFS transporter [Megamonas hypermegale]|uniref:MFS transporter n=1 Tax=Megamonas hypermegale TaxID=158847 RepID=A0A921HMY9_9FIRM|nr:MFS transporter [Megamonas hypermegale]HJF84594.1 MFS transporter [Megamonas hypermegale]
MTAEKNTIKGIIMFTLLLLSYIIFASNWVAGSNLSAQIIHYYFEGESVSPMVAEIINYTITIARIFANLLAAYVLLKLNPKKASIVALVLLCFAVIAVLATNYWLYTVSRMVMALGGSMIMVYMNTIIAEFIKNDKKIIANALVTASYNIGAGFVAVVFFLYKDIVMQDWQQTMYLFSAASIFLLVLWVILSEDFSPAGSGATQSEYKYSDALKDKFVYFFSFGLGGFLFLYVMSLVSIPVRLGMQAGQQFSSEFMILSITLGGILGTVFSIIISRYYFNRKYFLFLHGVLMIASMGAGIYLAAFNPVLAYISFGICGFIMFSQYTVYLNFPYELADMTPQRLTIMFGIFWAFGYSVYTILNFVWSLILSYYGWESATIFYIACSCLYIIFVLTFPKTEMQLKKATVL